MGRSNKFDYQAAIETSLIAHPEGLSLDEMIERAGLTVDRSTLFRHMAQLIEQGRVERLGKARATRYRLLHPAQPAAAPDLTPDSLQDAVAQAPGFSADHQPDAAPAEPQPLVDIAGAEPASASRRSVETAAYDAVVKKAVRTVVREWKRCDRINLHIYLSLLVKPDVLDELAAVVEKELAGLREDDLDKFGLTPLDYSRFNPSAAREAAGDRNPH